MAAAGLARGGPGSSTRQAGRAAGESRAGCAVPASSRISSSKLIISSACARDVRMGEISLRGGRRR
jgi:hypothetical protein